MNATSVPDSESIVLMREIIALEEQRSQISNKILLLNQKLVEILQSNNNSSPNSLSSGSILIGSKIHSGGNYTSVGHMSGTGSSYAYGGGTAAIGGSSVNNWTNRDRICHVLANGAVKSSREIWEEMKASTLNTVQSEISMMVKEGVLTREEDNRVRIRGSKE